MLRVLFLALIGVLLVVPFYLYKIVYPEFRSYVAQQTDITAILLAKQLLFSLDLTEIAGADPIPPVAQDFFRESVDRGVLYAVRVYDAKGNCTYSTTTLSPSLGEDAFFRDRIAHGEPFSRLLRQGTEPAPLFSAADMTETFIPVLESGIFCGAIALYQHTTFDTRSIELLAEHALWMLVGLLAIIAISKWFLMVHLGRMERRRNHLEKQILRSNSRLSQCVADQTYEISLGQQISVSALAKMAEYNDSDTGKHLTRMSSYARELARELRRNSPYAAQIIREGLDSETFGMAAVLHDIGKIAISGEILRKPGRLTEEEFTAMKRHTLVGADVLGEANKLYVQKIHKDSYLKHAADVARNHHEKWDGKGYWRLAGEDIPLSARIIALADVYDALRSQRPYKDPWTHLAAMQEIIGGEGSHFDPVIVDVFLRLEDRFNKIWEEFN